MQPRILVVDDEPDFVRFIEEVLKKENFTVISVGDGIKAIKMAGESRPDLILLDWNLPGKDGPQVCQALKADPKTRTVPVVMLTVRRKETDVVVGLEIGADDFVSKRGLRPRELVARVRAALRKSGPQPDPGEVLRSGPFALDTEKRRLTLNGQEVELRPKEYELIYVFMKNESRVLTRNFLEETIWGTEYFGSSRAIDSTVTRLRAKLGKQATAIEAVQGIGYRFEIP
ncbi:MAG: response regulator transcription factor [Elusimicrobia bacterium]|nr:response regulator transcription factor [Elusimicrobiota bacterium]